MAGQGFCKPDPRALNALLEREQGSPAGLIVLLAWRLGLSREEIRTLRWSQVDLKGGELALPDRRVPVARDLLGHLAGLKLKSLSGSDYVTAGPGAGPFSGPHVSRLARQALDGAGLREVRLSDLRRDYIEGLLAEHDWQYVSRVSGVGQAALKRYAAPLRPPEKRKGRAPAQPDGERIARLIEGQGYSPAGTAICLSYHAGLLARELRSLTWGQVDLERAVIELPGRTIPLCPDALDYLKRLKARGEGSSEYVAAAKRTGRPPQAAQLSKSVRAALVSAGLSEVSLSGLRRGFSRRTREEEPVLRLAAGRKGAKRRDLSALLGFTDAQAARCLRRMTHSGLLVRVGKRYYLPGRIPPPARHDELIVDYLRREGSAVRQDIARLLRLPPRQVYPILRALVSSGRIVLASGRYYPSSPDPSPAGRDM